MTLTRLVLAWLAALLLAAPAHAQTFPQRGTAPVVDAANLLTPEQEAQITALSQEVNRTTTRQFVVATVPSLEGYPIEDYGYKLGRAWGLGQKEADNGIILLVAPNERKVRIEVGYGLEPIMTDALSSTIINERILPRFKAGDMPGGILAGAQAIAEQMKLPLEAAEANAKAAADKKATRTANQRRSSGGNFPWGLLFWGIILVFVIFPMIFRRRERQGPWGARRYRRSGGSDLPIILWTIANEMSRSSHRGGSSWGGGGWSGGGGGGGFGGGGGGGFSGGGGSFGGGGASGSW